MSENRTISELLVLNENLQPEGINADVIIQSYPIDFCNERGLCPIKRKPVGSGAPDQIQADIVDYPGTLTYNRLKEKGWKCRLESDKAGVCYNLKGDTIPCATPAPLIWKDNEAWCDFSALSNQNLSPGAAIFKSH